MSKKTKTNEKDAEVGTFLKKQVLMVRCQYLSTLRRVDCRCEVFNNALTCFTFPFQKELLYKEVLYTIRNKIGGGGQSNQFLMLKDELYSYAKAAFRYDDETHVRLMELATEEKVWRKAFGLSKPNLVD